MRRDLDVLRAGRWAFVNTPKYVSITNSASFGNMVSMVLPTPLLPLPLAAKQILLNNFLCDLPSIAISSDNTDPDRVRHFTVIVIGYVAATEVAKIWFFQSS